MSQDGQFKRDNLWRLIRKKRTFTVAELYSDLTPTMHMTSIKTYVQQLSKAGIVIRNDVRKKRTSVTNIAYVEHQYKLVKDTGVHRPILDNQGKVRPPTGNQRIWCSIKVLKQFDHRDVTLTAQAPTNTVKTYLSVLCRAGYLKVVKKGTSHIPERYIFIGKKDTGPFAPRIRRNGNVYDANLKCDVWQKGVSNEA